jgi:Protein of unknown function (DUF3987)
MARAPLAAQAHYDVELPGPGIRPLTGIFSSVAGSGDRKSSVDRLATRPILQAEERFRRENQSAMEAYANDKEAWEAARQKAKKKGQQGGDPRGVERNRPRTEAPTEPHAVGRRSYAGGSCTSDVAGPALGWSVHR